MTGLAAGAISVMGTTRARLDHLRVEIDELVERRKNLVTTTIAELAAAGIEAVVIRKHKSPHQTYQHARIGERAYVYTCVEVDGSREPVHIPVFSGRPWGKEHAPLVEVPGNGVMYIGRGSFEAILIDEDSGDAGFVDTVWAKIEDVDEIAHRRAVTNLRGRARRDGFRVQARDRAITLIDPMNTVVHEGDVITASMWLLGIDPKEVDGGIRI